MLKPVRVRISTNSARLPDAFVNPKGAMKRLEEDNDDQIEMAESEEHRVICINGLRGPTSATDPPVCGKHHERVLRWSDRVLSGCGW